MLQMRRAGKDVRVGAQSTCCADVSRASRSVSRRTISVRVGDPVLSVSQPTVPTAACVNGRVTRSLPPHTRRLLDVPAKDGRLSPHNSNWLPRQNPRRRLGNNAHSKMKKREETKRKY